MLCLCCKEQFSGLSYHIPKTKLSMHIVCAMKPIAIVIDHPKRHLHPLTFFPKQDFLPCNICGLIKEHIPTYVCLQCVFVVHEDCVYFPNVIRISRHQHRISFTYSLPSGDLSCGVCRKKVDNNYCAYSCNNCSGYFVHSRCALRKDLWDGKELEGVPEEPEIVIEPFKKITDGIIFHFLHDHHLKIDICKIYDEDKFCHACALPVYGGNYYYCVDQCDFILHETCAYNPRKKHHPLHSLSLALKVERNFFCDACRQKGYSFFYEDPAGNYGLDLRCASVCEPFEYEGHEHALYLALTPEEEKAASCKICQETDYSCRKLNCIECDYIICFRCATLPYKARYKHDKHFLTFYEGKEIYDHSEWCDVCEKKIEDSTKKGFYSCDECCTTLHIDCLLGKIMSIKPCSNARFSRKTVDVLRNNTMSRPFCSQCNQRCQGKLVIKYKFKVFCSSDCWKFFDLFH